MTVSIEMTIVEVQNDSSVNDEKDVNRLIANRCHVKMMDERAQILFVGQSLACRCSSRTDAPVSMM